MNNVGKTTLARLRRLKKNGIKISMTTSYDYISGKIADDAGINIVLIGDSLANTCLGMSKTLNIKLPAMLHHTQAVTRAVEKAFTIADIPFGASQGDPGDIIKSAVPLVQDGNADSVKIEGFRPDVIKYLVDNGIATVAHLGLLPQSVALASGYTVRAKSAAAAEQLIDRSLELESCGASLLVLEAIPEIVAQQITSRLHIPTIGVGAGRFCDGQCIIFSDLVGFSEGKTPKFAKRYLNAGEQMRKALTQFHTDVVEGQYPSEEHGYSMREEEQGKFMQSMGRHH